MKQIIKCILLNLIVLGYMPVSASVIIDNFEDAQSVVSSVPGVTTNTKATGNALGGFRTLSIIDGGAFSTATVDALDSNVFSHNASAGVAASTTVTWDAGGSGLGGLDLLTIDTLDFLGSTCFECFVLEIISIDQGNTDLTIELEDTFSVSSSFTSVNATLGLFEILFSEFSNVNLTLINSISLRVDSSASTDLQLNLLGYTGAESQQILPAPSVVPVSPTTWLLFSGLVGFFAFRKSGRTELV